MAVTGPATAADTASAPVPSGGSVAIDGRAPGYDYTVRLTIVGWDKSEVAVDQTSSNVDGVRPEIRRVGHDVKIAPVGGTVKRNFFGWFHWGNSNVAWTVHVPRSAVPVTSMSDNSRVDVNGVSGPLNVETTNGGIGIDGAGPEVIAKTTNGSVHVRIASLNGRPPRVTISSVNGSVHLFVPREFRTRVETQTSNGSIDNPFSNANGPGSASVSTSNGSITIGG